MKCIICGQEVGSIKGKPANQICREQDKEKPKQQGA